MTPLRALVAEDEPAMLSLVARHLRNLGFSVVEASEGDAAWELAQRHVPDLVILDVMMPGMSGWEVCKRLKGDAPDGRRFASTGVIMLTGIGENLNDMTSPLFAADAWLNKPFNFEDLDDRIRETLRRYDKGLPGPERAANGVGAAPASAKKAVAKAAPAKKASPKKAAAKKPAARPAAKVAAAKKPATKPAAKKVAKKRATKTKSSSTYRS
jgi:DNA-binding response OmpR family regulator